MNPDPTKEPMGSTLTPAYDDLEPVLRLDPPLSEAANQDGTLLLRLEEGAVRLLMAPLYLHAADVRCALQRTAVAIEEALRVLRHRTGQGLIDALRCQMNDLEFALTFAQSFLEPDGNEVPSLFVPVSLDDGVSATVRGTPTRHWPTDEEMAHAFREAAEPGSDAVVVMELPGPGMVPKFHTISGGDADRIRENHGIDIE